VGTVSREQIDVLTDARRGVRTIHSHINTFTKNTFEFLFFN
jgi:hypothetical protein